MGGLLGAQGGELGEASARFRMHGLKPGQLLEPPQRQIDIAGVELDAVAAPPSLLGGEQRGAAAEERIRTIPCRFEQSSMASATSATGLTVGCSAKSARSAPKAVAPV